MSSKRKDSHDSKAVYIASAVEQANRKKKLVKITIDGVMLEISPGDDPNAVLESFKAAVQKRQGDSLDLEREMRQRLKIKLQNA